MEAVTMMTVLVVVVVVVAVVVVVVTVVVVAVLMEMVTTISDNLTACRGVHWARIAVCVWQDTPDPFFTHTLP